MSDKERAIAERVAKKMVAGSRIGNPAFNKLGRAMKVGVEILPQGDEDNPLPGRAMCSIEGEYFFDADSLDTFIDTLQMVQRRL
jgi:hypothetical protein